MTLPEGFKYETATNADFPAIKNLINQVLKEYSLGSTNQDADLELIDLEKNYREGYFGLIRSQDNNLIATFALFKLNENIAEIRKMYLLPEFRSKGIGKWMLNFLIQKANSLGYKKIELQTASVLQAAIAMYKKTGFDEVTNSNASSQCDKAFEMYL